MSTFLHRIHTTRARIDAAVALAFVLSSLCLAVALGAGIAAAGAEPTIPDRGPSTIDEPAGEPAPTHSHGS